jgi:hypothetical protein
VSSIVPRNLVLRKETVRMLVLPAIVALVGIGAFGLGRLSALGQKGRLVIHAPDMPAGLAHAIPLAPAAAAPGTVPLGQAGSTNGNFVASKNGTKYYTAGCSGASRIKPENQVWFATDASAQAAGYSLSSTCK